ncbi:helix-turn-helix transcriptional regulator [Jannaschia sp. Os4]|uniref:helix-turn-helix domain-containing protein n=1 Tax=Jannaschia sp. Os4 TaxID=2807617 RepID=UPI001939407A|nr:helix-turn-helix transcriptional regulator [Jannaschia sp. Os4]MBM2578175.1 helix-turn-helix transcriptional regulator [Jannaschia sp. Os4]
MDRRDDAAIDAFARTLQSRRRAQGLSQEELAYRAGLSTSYISLLETRRRQPTLSVMVGLARELGISLTVMAEDIEASHGRAESR